MPDHNRSSSSSSSNALKPHNPKQDTSLTIEKLKETIASFSEHHGSWFRQELYCQYRSIELNSTLTTGYIYGIMSNYGRPEPGTLRAGVYFYKADESSPFKVLVKHHNKSIDEVELEGSVNLEQFVNKGDKIKLKILDNEDSNGEFTAIPFKNELAQFIISDCEDLQLTPTQKSIIENELHWHNYNQNLTFYNFMMGILEKGYTDEHSHDLELDSHLSKPAPEIDRANLSQDSDSTSVVQKKPFTSVLNKMLKLLNATADQIEFEEKEKIVSEFRNCTEKLFEYDNYQQFKSTQKNENKPRESSPKLNIKTSSNGETVFEQSTVTQKRQQTLDIGMLSPPRETEAPKTQSNPAANETKIRKQPGGKQQMPPTPKKRKHETRGTNVDLLEFSLFPRQNHRNPGTRALPALIGNMEQNPELPSELDEYISHRKERQSTNNTSESPKNNDLKTSSLRLV